MKEFTPITTQAELDRIVTARLAQQARQSDARKWEERAKQHAEDAATWRREARRWERRARENLAVVRAHEQTIEKFIDRLDDVLTED